MDQETLNAAAQRLSEERRRQETLRSDYARIASSRFHALRMLWFSIKALLGMSSPEDRYAVWSPGMAVSVGSAPERVINPEPAVYPDRATRPQAAPSHLLASWRSRIETRPLESSAPIVSVVIPVYNELSSTIRCLQSIADSWFETLGVQIIAVDDGSTDGTADVLTALPGLDYIKNGSNQGFIRACNRGAAIARGTYICFLNNDTVVREGWLDHLVTMAESDPAIGAVGSKLVYPDGSLQEAGGVIWRDGTGWNYGRGENAADSRYNYARDTDYCSGAALMVRRELFEQLGGFSEDYVPAYYEDVDLCFGVRSLGFRVVYQPRSEVVHYEGVTSGTDLSSGVKRFQEINRPKFRDKWAQSLESHYENEPSAVTLATRRLRSGPSILIVDSYVPMYDKDAGSSRLMEIIRILSAARFNVIFLPDNYAPLQPYTEELQAMGVEVLHHSEGGRAPRAALEGALKHVDLAWICRPNLFAKYAPLVRRNSGARIIYDTIDLHFMRMRREAELTGAGETAWKKTEREELSAAREADATVVVTESEKRLLHERDVRNVYVVPTIHNLEVEEERRFEDSAGVLFIGGYNHPPNVDAARWLCCEIMPRVWERDPKIVLTLLGSNPPDSLLALQSNTIRVPGFVRDVRTHFMAARVFAAPLRFGAGMNGKVGHALSFRLPVVLTELAAEGFGLADGEHCLIANDAGNFADAIVRLYTEPKLWTRLSRSAPRVLEQFQRPAIAPRLLKILDEIASAGTEVRRAAGVP
jgi:GT2 family glycosyltransferase